LYARTLRHLRARQLVAQVSRRLFSRRSGKRVPETAGFRGLTPRRSFAAPALPAASLGSITFLNQTRVFDPQAPDWCAAEMPKLWRYNLHYFDYLHWPSYSLADKTALIDDWIVRVTPGEIDGCWEAYPLSLRIVNWLKFLAVHPAGAVPRPWLSSLTTQLNALRGTLEYHLLANHLLKNAKALLLGGVAFVGPIADEWLRCGLEILRAETDEQILPDGGHFERSPMYHCIVLEDYLDMVNVLAAHPGRVPAQDMERIVAAARRATAFLWALLGGDDEFPLFNDAGYGIAKPTTELLNYSEAVLTAVGETAAASHTIALRQPTRLWLPESGYYGYRYGGDSLIVDCGPIGPDYQPGHAHCDTLSFELCVGGRRVVVDSGVYGYELDPMREYVRSTRAHNTVMIDGVEQSEIWGGFRVARRARPLRAEFSEWQDGQLRFLGAHDGYHRIRGQIDHQRELLIQQTGRWEVRDHVTGRGRHRIESFIHFHPSCTVQALCSDEWRITVAGGPVLKLSVYGGAVRLAEGWYCPEFGKRVANAVLVIECEGRLPIECGYVLKRVPVDAA
jgi:uncharacterized heparinase superfamily protein